MLSLNHRRWRCLSQPPARLVIWLVVVVLLAVVVQVLQVPVEHALGIAVGGVFVSHALTTWVLKGLPGGPDPGAQAA